MSERDVLLRDLDMMAESEGDEWSRRIAAQLRADGERIAALEKALAKGEADLRAVGGYDNELLGIPAGGVRDLLARLRAALTPPPAPEA